MTPVKNIRVKTANSITIRRLDRRQLDLHEDWFSMSRYIGLRDG